MRKWDVVRGGVAAACLLVARGAVAGPWEDGMAAYNRGDYCRRSIRLFRPLAEYRSELITKACPVCSSKSCAQIL
jgi:hypothetical protein